MYLSFHTKNQVFICTLHSLKAIFKNFFLCISGFVFCIKMIWNDVRLAMSVWIKVIIVWSGDRKFINERFWVRKVSQHLRTWLTRIEKVFGWQSIPSPVLIFKPKSVSTGCEKWNYCEDRSIKKEENRVKNYLVFHFNQGNACHFLYGEIDFSRHVTGPYTNE